MTADDTAGAGGFTPATGDDPPSGVPTTVRAAEVRTAFEGLLQIRRLANRSAGDPSAVPATWECNRPVRAVALVLEASGVSPSAVDESGLRITTGFRVCPGERPGTVRVEWLGPPGGEAAQQEERALTLCAAVLRPLGWEGLLYRGPRRRRFLEVEPLS